jgi:hypothetical protein
VVSVRKANYTDRATAESCTNTFINTVAYSATTETLNTENTRTGQDLGEAGREEQVSAVCTRHTRFPPQPCSQLSHQRHHFSSLAENLTSQPSKWRTVLSSTPRPLRLMSPYRNLTSEKNLKQVSSTNGKAVAVQSKSHAMKMYGGRGNLHKFITSALAEDEIALIPDRFTSPTPIIYTHLFTAIFFRSAIR